MEAEHLLASPQHPYSEPPHAPRTRINTSSCWRECWGPLPASASSLSQPWNPPLVFHLTDIGMGWTSSHRGSWGTAVWRSPIKGHLAPKLTASEKKHQVLTSCWGGKKEKKTTCFNQCRWKSTWISTLGSKLNLKRSIMAPPCVWNISTAFPWSCSRQKENTMVSVTDRAFSLF